MSVGGNRKWLAELDKKPWGIANPSTCAQSISRFCWVNIEQTAIEQEFEKYPRWPIGSHWLLIAGTLSFAYRVILEAYLGENN